MRKLIVAILMVTGAIGAKWIPIVFVASAVMACVVIGECVWRIQSEKSKFLLNGSRAGGCMNELRSVARERQARDYEQLFQRSFTMTVLWAIGTAFFAGLLYWSIGIIGLLMIMGLVLGPPLILGWLFIRACRFVGNTLIAPAVEMIAIQKHLNK